MLYLSRQYIFQVVCLASHCIGSIDCELADELANS